jgi:hypothetical protein
MTRQARVPAIKCQRDSGSMYGNVPICSERATVRSEYDVPCYGTFVNYLCARHARSESGRVYPSTVRQSAISD